MNNIELLKFQIEMGADENIGNQPINNLIAKEKRSPLPTTKPIQNSPVMPASPAIIGSNTLASPQKAAEEARALADACKTLAELEKAVRAFDGCSIKKTATNTVFCDGNPKSDIMFIGEAPGAQEDIEGIPFCGESGKLLDNMLKWVGLTRKDNFYITNTIFWRPPGNRKPTPEETAICKPLVEKHIALINPKLLVLVGGTATTALLDTKLGITKLRGKFHEYTNSYLDKTIPVGILFHPSYLLRSPGQKRYAWQDLLSIKHKLEELA